MKKINKYELGRILGALACRYNDITAIQFFSEQGGFDENGDTDYLNILKMPVSDEDKLWVILRTFILDDEELLFVVYWVWEHIIKSLLKDENTELIENLESLISISLSVHKAHHTLPEYTKQLDAIYLYLTQYLEIAWIKDIISCLTTDPLTSDYSLVFVNKAIIYTARKNTGISDPSDEIYIKEKQRIENQIISDCLHNLNQFINN